MSLLPFDVAMARHEISRYVDNWARPGDAAVIATGGPDGAPIGAAWYRLFPQDDPGYGYVDSGTPELSVGVDTRYRGIGVGRALLDALVERARAEGFSALSLSVEPDNRIALGLYEQLGFQVAGVNEGSLTMVLDLTKHVDR